MRHLTTLIVLPLLVLPAHAQMVTISPEQIGQIFCIGSLGNDMAPVEGLLSPDLSVLVANAWARNAGFVEQAPDDKPPLGDGLPWRTWPDYADGCTVAETTQQNEQARVEIRYSFAETAEADYANVLILKQVVPDDGTAPAWRIDDIDLLESRTFRSTLAGAFASE